MQNFTVRSEQIEELIRKACKEKTTPDGPGGVVAVLHKSKLVFNYPFGYANLDHRTPTTEDTVFYIASLSKQFTAMCALLLVDEGRLDLGRSLRHYFPEFPSYADKVTVRNLLHHTSGLRGYINLLFYRGQFDPLVFDKLAMDDVFKLLVRQSDVNFLPGERYEYTNTGYVLLALLVDRLSGQSFPDFVKEHVFDPLGMKTALFITNPSEVIPHYAEGYKHDGENFQLFTTRSAIVGSTGMVCSVEDMVRWDQCLSNCPLGSGKIDILEQMLTKGQLEDGSSVDYACGLLLEDHKGHQVIRHTGPLFGYDTAYLKFPVDVLSVVVFANLLNFGANTLANDIADLLLGLKPADEEVQSPAENRRGKEEVSDVSHLVSEEIFGLYKSRKTKATLVVEPEGCGLNLNIYGLAGEPHRYFPQDNNDFVLVERCTSSVNPPNRLKFSKYIRL